MVVLTKRRYKFVKRGRFNARSRTKTSLAIPRYVKSGANAGNHFFKRWCCLTTSNTNTATAGSVGAAISQSADSWNINTGTTANVSYYSFAHMFTLGMLPDYAEFTTLFDQYKISGVKLRITPYSTAQMAQTGVGTANNQTLSVLMHSVLDHDDYTAPAAGTTGINALRQYRTYKTRNFLARNGQPINIWLRPRIATAAYGSGVFSSYANSKPLWIDCDSINVEHYGIKYICEVFQPDTTVPCFVWFKIEAKLYISLREPR